MVGIDWRTSITRGSQPAGDGIIVVRLKHLTA